MDQLFISFLYLFFDAWTAILTIQKKSSKMLRMLMPVKRPRVPPEQKILTKVNTLTMQWKVLPNVPIWVANVTFLARTTSRMDETAICEGIWVTSIWALSHKQILKRLLFLAENPQQFGHPMCRWQYSLPYTRFSRTYLQVDDGDVAHLGLVPVVEVEEVPAIVGTRVGLGPRRLRLKGKNRELLLSTRSLLKNLGVRGRLPHQRLSPVVEEAVLVREGLVLAKDPAWRSCLEYEGISTHFAKYRTPGCPSDP